MINIQLAHARFNAFLNWTNAHALKFERVGLDIEVDMRELQMLQNRSVGPLLETVAHDLNLANFHTAKAQFDDFIAYVSESYSVETYMLAPLLDERMVANATLMQRLLGTIDCGQVKYQVPMLYSSLYPHGAGQLASYGPECNYIAIGSTGSSGAVGGGVMTWETLSRDLVFSAKHVSTIYVYALQGTQQHGWLDLMVSMPLAFGLHSDLFSNFQWLCPCRLRPFFSVVV